jgi:hypothetical protein
MGGSTAASSASARSGVTTGAAAAFAGTVMSGIAWKWSHETGAVASPHAVEIAMHCASGRGTG